MSARALWPLLVACLCGLIACPSPPASFRVIDLAEAKRLVEAGEVDLLEAPEVMPAAPRAPEASRASRRGVLVFGVNERSTRARAAAVARAGNRTVLVFVPRDADERGRFYAVASPAEEDRRGEDS